MISCQKGNFEVISYARKNLKHKIFLQNERNSLMSHDHSEISYSLDIQLSKLFVYSVGLGLFVSYVHFIVNKAH